MLGRVLDSPQQNDRVVVFGAKIGSFKPGTAPMHTFFARGFLKSSLSRRFIGRGGRISTFQFIGVSDLSFANLHESDPIQDF